MGSLMEELAKIHIDALDSARKLNKEMAEPGKWEVLAGKTGEEEKNKKVVDDLNRARDLSELEAIFGRLGIDKKLEALKPDLALCKRIIGKDVHYVDERVVFSVKRIVEFIETIDEP